VAEPLLISNAEWLSDWTNVNMRLGGESGNLNPNNLSHLNLNIQQTHVEFVVIDFKLGRAMLCMETLDSDVTLESRLALTA
jgi:hypothetical protein